MISLLSKLAEIHIPSVDYKRVTVFTRAFAHHSISCGQYNICPHTYELISNRMMKNA
jgi:hypothetical protein